MKKMKAYESFDAYLADQRPAHRTIIRALRKLVARVRPELEESVKWGNGCWIGDEGPVAYVYAGADHVQLGFFMGSSLTDPRGLLEGEGSYVRFIRLRAATDIDARSFAPLLREAAGTARARRAATARKKPAKEKPAKSPAKRAARRGPSPRARR